MDGHRRIANDLFWQHAARGEWKEIAALLTIDGDHRDGGKKGLRAVAEYARMFGQSRTWVRTRIRHYLHSRSQLYSHSWPGVEDTQETGEGQGRNSLGTRFLSQSPEPGASSSATVELESRASTPSEREPWGTLTNILSRLPGSLEEKREWIADNWEQLQADADRTNPPTPNARNATLKSLTIRYYRRHVNGGQPRAEARSEGWRRAMKQAHAAAKVS